MATSLEQVTREVVELTKHQRLALAGFILEMDNASDDPSIDAEWEQEIQARIQAIDAGKAVGIPSEDIMRDAARLLEP